MSYLVPLPSKYGRRFTWKGVEIAILGSYGGIRRVNSLKAVVPSVQKSWIVVPADSGTNNTSIENNFISKNTYYEVPNVTWKSDREESYRWKFNWNSNHFWTIERFLTEFEDLWVIEIPKIDTMSFEFKFESKINVFETGLERLMKVTVENDDT